MKLLFLLLISSLSLASTYPPTTSKSSSDASDIVTWNYRFPNFTGTHTGAIFSLGTLSTSGGGTGTTSWTTGSIPYYNGSILTQDNANLFWDGTNHRLGIDTNSPNYTLVVNGTAGVGNILINGSSAGYILQNAAPTTTAYFITWPSAQGTGVLTNNGAGALSWSGSTVPVLGNYEVNSTSAESTASTTDVLLTSMTITPVAGTYLVTFSSWCSQSNGAQSITLGIYNGATLLTHTQRVIIPFVNLGLASTLDIPVATNAILVANGSNAITIQWHVSGGTGTCTNRTLDLVRIQ
jgi:hypothetical protein